MKKYILLLLALCLTMTVLLTSCGSETEMTPSDENTVPEGFEGEYEVKLTIKDYGTITLELDADSAPITVENFVTLAKDGFYDGLTFHRIIDGFMIQGGDPKGNGTGGSDKNIKGEFTANGVDNTMKHTRGDISMARSKQYDSASSQFFIVHKTSDHLDGAYAVFGYVTSGMNIVDKICEDARPTDNNGSIRASEQPVIESVTVTEK